MKNGLSIGVFPVLEIIAPNLEFYFASRKGGVSEPPYDSLNLGGELEYDDENIKRNRSILLQSLGISVGRVARCGQVHGSTIRVVKSGGIWSKTDGLITNFEGIALAINTADCYPVVVYSPPENALAALHVGRGGAAGGIIHKAMNILSTQFKIRTECAIALIGPGICAKCYRINGRIARRFPSGVVKKRNGRFHLDLSKFIKRELRKCGIRRRNIFESKICTSCRSDICFSYRRDRGLTGRHWTLARITDRAALPLLATE